MTRMALPGTLADDDNQRATPQRKPSEKNIQVDGEKGKFSVDDDKHLAETPDAKKYRDSDVQVSDKLFKLAGISKQKMVLRRFMTG